MYIYIYIYRERERGRGLPLLAGRSEPDDAEHAAHHLLHAVVQAMYKYESTCMRYLSLSLSLYIYIYVFIYLYVYLSISLSLTYIYIYIYICIYTHIRYCLERLREQRQSADAHSKKLHGEIRHCAERSLIMLITIIHIINHR